MPYLPWRQQIDSDREAEQSSKPRKQTTQCRGEREIILAQDFLQLAKIRRPEARHRVPTLGGLSERRISHGSVTTQGREGQRTLKPGVPHPGAFPLVTSFKPGPPIEYSIGLRKPSGGFRAASCASFRRATMPATVGVDAEVPPINAGEPWKKIRKFSDWAETSG